MARINTSTTQSTIVENCAIAYSVGTKAIAHKALGVKSLSCSRTREGYDAAMGKVNSRTGYRLQEERE